MNTSSFAMKDLLTSYTETRECDYKGRHYSVRDNGSILRHPKQGCRSSKLDNVWTFGTKDRYIHKNIRTFFTEDGAMKYYTLTLGQEWTMGDVMEDYC